MNKKVNARKNTITVVLSYVNDPVIAALILTYLTMKNDVVHFKVNVDAMNVEIEISLTDFTAISRNQKIARVNLGAYLFPKICAPSMRYARGIGDEVMMAIFEPTASQLKKIPLTTIMERTKVIIDRAEVLLTTVPAYVTLTGMTTEIIDGARLLQTAMEALLGKAKSMKKEVSRAKTKIKKIQRDIWDFDFANLMDDAQHFNDTRNDNALLSYF